MSNNRNLFYCMTIETKIAGIEKENALETTEKREKENEERMIEFMKSDIKANELYVSKVCAQLEERIKQGDQSDILVQVYRRIKYSSTPSLVRLTEQEQIDIQTIFRGIISQVGKHHTRESSYERFNEEKGEQVEYGMWLQVANGIIRDEIDFYNEKYGMIAWDLYYGSSTAIKTILETFI